MSVLVVDDDAAIRRLLSVLLQRTNAEVKAVPDGHDALACLESRPYSVVILDLMMPVTDGFELLDHVSESMPEVLNHIIVLTAGPQNAIDKLDQTPVWGVIRKPFDIDDLLRSVADCAAQGSYRLEM
jgi:CheY-like chemotaxis protein